MGSSIRTSTVNKLQTVPYENLLFWCTPELHLDKHIEVKVMLSSAEHYPFSTEGTELQGRAHNFLSSTSLLKLT